ncbi:MAG: limonene-1,2-epoxide hydrolase family protein [Ilumatobacteraceae bacterium]
MPADVVNSFIRAVEQLDLDRALTHLTEDVEYDNVPFGPVHGRDAVRATLGPFMAGFEEVQWVVHHQLVQGNLDQGLVMNERLDRFRKGDRWLDLPVAGLFVVRHGQISLWRDYFDKETMFAAMAALG